MLDWRVNHAKLKLWIESGSSLRGGRVLLSVLLFPSILALLVSPSTRLWVSCYIVCTVTWLLIQPLETFTIHHPLKLGLENAGPIKHGPLLPCWTSGLQIFHVGDMHRCLSISSYLTGCYGKGSIDKWILMISLVQMWFFIATFNFPRVSIHILTPSCHDHAVDKSGLFTTNHCPQTPANRPRNSLWPALSHWARGSKAKAWCERPEAIHITVRLSESIIVSLCNYILYYILISYNILHEGIERITNAKHTECRDLLWYGRWRVVRMSHPLHPCGSLTVAAWGCYELCKWLLTST